MSPYRERTGCLSLVTSSLSSRDTGYHQPIPVTTKLSWSQSNGLRHFGDLAGTSLLLRRCFDRSVIGDFECADVFMQVDDILNSSYTFLTLKTDIGSVAFIRNCFFQVGIFKMSHQWHSIFLVQLHAIV